MTDKNDIKAVVAALEQNNFDPVIYVEKAQDAIPAILALIPEDATLG